MADVLQHRKLYEQVVERIRHQILAGELTSGDQLPNERNLGERYGVSRTVIREAMKTLIQSGLVEVRRGQGTFVVDGTADALKQSLRMMMGLASEERVGEMVEVRELLEPEIAARAARYRKHDDLEALKRAIEDMDAALDDADTFIEADNRFHVALAVATQNHFIPRLLDSVVDLLQELRGHIFQVGGGPVRGQRHHRRILAAIEARDADAARTAMLAHLTQVRRDSKQALRPSGPGADAELDGDAA
ncbi:MAG TPA: FadR/GntR family transcriptional regulator [Trueperaceae bacterium]|nr:FadR/GntR family transcriptional regulator [Trueperaceae bacterium]